MTQQRICSTCGYVGKPKTVTKGSMLMEIALWLFFLIPGLLYSTWRLSSRHKACPACGSTTMIPLETPTGKKLLSEQGKTIEQVLAENTPSGEYRTPDRIAVGIAIVLGVLVLLAVYRS